MVRLTPIPFCDLIRRLHRELETKGSIFDLPERKWFRPNPALDLSAAHHDHRPATPVGPAAGPHTQLAQNIVLSWLAGSRIIELKTVQHEDRLTIPRPCIRIPNVGYNVEWSQELRVEESIREYAKAHYLIAILKASRVFGRFPQDAAFETVFDVSVGYDIASVRSDKVTRFLRAMQDASEVIDSLRREMPPEYRHWRDLDVAAQISDCVTLSTFHGCPAFEIEAIARYLLEQIGVHTIIKLNPTLLGFEAVRELLHDILGYTQITLRSEAFQKDLRYDDGLEMISRLTTVADDLGATVGLKFTNTLVVANDPDLFPTQADPYMYLSGPPLHVIAMTLMHRFRQDAGLGFPVSFSAGVDAVNFPDTVACGMVPVTTCTDLLKQGGYGRLPVYLRALRRRMEGLGVSSLDAYVMSERGHGAVAAETALRSVGGGSEAWQTHGSELSRLAAEAPEEFPAALTRIAEAAGLDVAVMMPLAYRIAGQKNADDIVPALAENPRYHAARNSKWPRRIKRQLGLYDCINCDLCIPACPNDAMFAYELPPVECGTQVWESVETSAGEGPGGVPLRMTSEPGAGFARRETHQLAVVADCCNDCSNCEMFCPEIGAPFVVKERFFLTRESFEQAGDLDGHFRQEDTLFARFDGIVYRLTLDWTRDRFTLRGGGLTAEVDWAGVGILSARSTGPVKRFDTAFLWRMKTAWDGVFKGSSPNMLNIVEGDSPVDDPSRGGARDGSTGGSSPAGPR